MPDPVIGLLTDFGISDTYVGVMKGVIARIAPQARLIDLTHEVPPGNLRHAAFKLWQAVPYFPAGTVFLCVVDPGVGTARRPIAVAWPQATFVGPDNGLCSYLLESEPATAACELQSASYRLDPVSTTFHGRDVFAPAAAHLATGVPIDRFGPPARDLVRLPHPRLEPEGAGVLGEVLHVDRFGNVTTSIGLLRPEDGELALRSWIRGGPHLHLPAQRLRVRIPGRTQLAVGGTFADVPEGQALAYVGSDGLLEIAVNRGRADAALGLSPGDPILLVPEG